MISSRTIYSALRDFVHDFLADNPLRLAAALSYYTLLSLAPLLLVVIALAGLVFGREAVQGQIVEQIRMLVGESGAEVIQTVIANASGPKQGAVSLAIGVLTLLIGATSVFAELQSALNKIWNVEADPNKSALSSFVKDRLLSLAMVIGIGFLLLVSLMISAGLSAFGDYASGWAVLTPAFWQVINVGVSFLIVTMLIAMMFKFLPDVKLDWRNVWFGALVTAFLFTIGKYLIGLYLGHASIGSSYGAAGSVIVLMVWVYYASLIIFLGAEITQVHKRRSGERAKPTERAVVKVRN